MHRFRKQEAQVVGRYPIAAKMGGGEFPESAKSTLKVTGFNRPIEIWG